MKKVFLALIIAMVGVGFTYAQELTKEEKKALKEKEKFEKKEAKRVYALVDEAQEKIETDPKGAANVLKEALTSKYTMNDPKVWYVSGRINQKLSEKEGEKNYLKQPYDTVLFHESLYQMYLDYIKCDELEQIPDAKGKVNVKYRVLNAEIMNQFRQNLIVGGIYFFNSNKNQKAFDFFSMFIDVAYEPMMESYYLKDDSINFSVAYYSCLAGMKMEDYGKVIKYIDLAMQDPENGESALQYKAMSLKELGDSAAWLSSLKEGAEKYPVNKYFYQELISYYDSHSKMNELTEFAEQMVARDPNNTYFLYVEGYIYQNVKNYDKAIEFYTRALEIDPEFVNALNNLGLCYWQQARDYNDNVASKDFQSAQYKKDKEIIKGYYKKALPIYEKLREIRPDEQNLWVNGLYTCYYNLEMGKELKEIEKLLPPME